MRTNRLFSPRLTAIALAAVFTQPALAVVYTWQGGDGNWEDPARWTLLGIPGSGDTAIINNTSTGSVVLSTTRSIEQLTMNGGRIGGAGTLNTNTLVFNGGTLGATFQGPGGTVNVSGLTQLNGAGTLSVLLSHQLNLNGNTTWGAGDGRINVDGAYTSGGPVYAAAAITIGAGATFADRGAASATSYKQIGFAGAVNNAGTYNRTGLGETYAVGFNNNGTLNVVEGQFSFASGNYRGSSSGVINVAQGASLWVANTTFAGGSQLNNNGVVRVYAGISTLEAGAVTSGAWVMDAGQLDVNGTQTMGSFNFNGGKIGAAGTLNLGSFVFNGGTLGAAAFGTGGTVNVAGGTTLNGSSTLGVAVSHTLNLNGTTTWTAGNGRINVDGAYFSGSSSYATAAINIGAGTTFADQGAASAGGVRQIGVGGGRIANAGTYERNGLGTTTAGNFQNAGQLNVNAGTLEVDARFGNTGTVRVASGALLAATESVFANAGVLTGTGMVKTHRTIDALANTGTIDPGSVGAGPVGTLTVAGGLTMLAGSTLHIDFGSTGAADAIAVSNGATWAGTLAVWAPADRMFTLGETYVIASYGQRLSSSTFNEISWLGSGSNPFTVDYHANDITLRVSAVPEPGSLALMLAGALALGIRRRPMASWRRPLAAGYDAGLGK